MLDENGHGTLDDLWETLMTKLTIPNCRQCGIPKTDRIALYCDACQSILDSLNNSDYWFALSNEWVDENRRRIEAKQRMLGGDQKAV
jgi:hypothetical protein